MNGVKTLEATTISNWAAAYTAGYIVILLAGNWPIDYFGRKFCLLWVQLLMVVACLQQMFANNWQLWLASKLFDVRRLFSCWCSQLNSFRVFRSASTRRCAAPTYPNLRRQMPGGPCWRATSSG